MNDQLDSAHTADHIDSIIQPYRLALSEKMEENIGELLFDLVRESPECNMGNWIADVMRSSGEEIFNATVDLALCNMSSFSIPFIQKGAITLQKMYELYPFDNTLVRMEISGSDLKNISEIIGNKGGWPVSRGTIFALRKDGSKFLTVNGNGFSPDSIYALVVPDYLAKGGEGCTFLQDRKRVESKVLLRELLIQDIRKNKCIQDWRYNDIEHRIRVE